MPKEESSYLSQKTLYRGSTANFLLQQVYFDRYALCEAPETFLFSLKGRQLHPTPLYVTLVKPADLFVQLQSAYGTTLRP